MDLFTGNAAYSMHQAEARRREQDMERLRMIKERSTAATVAKKSAKAASRPAGIRWHLPIFRSHRPAAQ